MRGVQPTIAAGWQQWCCVAVAAVVLAASRCWNHVFQRPPAKTLGGRDSISTCSERACVVIAEADVSACAFAGSAALSLRKLQVCS